MSNPFEDAIDSVYSDNPTGFQDAVNSILADKLKERIGVEKVAVAQSFLNEPEADVDNVTSDEPTE